MRRIGPKPVSSSRTTTLATKAVVTNMKKMEKASEVTPMAKGELTWTLAVEPIWMLSLATEPKVRRKKRPPATQKTGFFSW